MSLVQPNQILKDAQGEEYLILRYLGEGLTAEVYAARRDDKTIALKILKPDLPADIVDSFRDEATILSTLANFERQEGDGLSLIPHVEGRAFEPQLPFKFLGLELVEGIPLTDLIEQQGGLSGEEEKALLIADQVLRVLDILHTYLRRSYTDFQLKNIWWQEEAGQVKVMDWNHVSPPAKERERPPDINNDLLRFGAYLYQILTGKGVGEGSLADGRTEFLLAKRAGQHWQDISVGTRAIILQALHPNPNQRWQTAQAMRQAVQQHQQRWQEPVGDISTGAVRAVRAVRRSEPQDAPEHIQQAELYIDLFLHRGEDEALLERLQNELAELTRNVSANWGSGLQYYKAGIHSKSTPIWKEEAETLGRLALWRWVMLSQLGESVSSDLFEAVGPDLEAALRFMEDGDWEMAVSTLQKAQEQEINGEPLQALTNELQAHQSYREAQISADIRQWTAAAAAYRKTADYLSRIPLQYRTLLQESYGWQTLEAKIHACVDKVADSDVSLRLIDELRQAFDQSFADGLKLLRETLAKIPDNPALPEFVEETADPLPNQQAIDLLYMALRWGDMHSHEVALRQLLASKRAAQKQAEDKMRLADLQQQAQAAFQDDDGDKLKELLVQLGSATPPKLIKQLQLKFDGAVEQHFIYRAATLADLLDLADENGAEARSQQLDALPSQLGDETHAWLDNLPVRVNKLLQSGKYTAAHNEIKEVKDHYANNEKFVAQAEKLEPGIGIGEQVNSCLEAADRQLRHREGDFFERAKESCAEADNLLQSWDGKWLDTVSYEERLNNIQQDIVEGEKKRVERVDGIALDNALAAFSKKGLDAAAKRIKMKLKNLYKINGIQLAVAMLTILLLVVGLYFLNSSVSDLSQMDDQISGLHNSIGNVDDRVNGLQNSINNVENMIVSAPTPANVTQELESLAETAQANTEAIAAITELLSAPPPESSEEDVSSIEPPPADPWLAELAYLAPADIYFDLPDMNLVAPEGWQFIREGDEWFVEEGSEGGTRWGGLQMIIDEQSIPIPSTIITHTENITLTISWSSRGESLPILPGNHTYSFRITNLTDPNITRDTSPTEITITEAPRGTIKDTSGYVETPSLSPEIDEYKQVEIIGQTTATLWSFDRYETLPTGTALTQEEVTRDGTRLSTGTVLEADTDVQRYKQEEFIFLRVKLLETGQFHWLLLNNLLDEDKATIEQDWLSMLPELDED